MEDFFENDLVSRFEEMMENNLESYFDVEEMEDIVVYYLEVGDYSFAEFAVNHALKLHPNSIDIKTKQLELLLEFENYPKSKKLIDELKDICKDDTDFLICCAKYYSNLGNAHRAIEFCHRALQNKEEEVFLHNFIADEYYNLKDPFNALKHYKIAISYDPMDEYALECCMQCFNDLKKNKESLDFLNRHLDEYPYSSTAWQELGNYYFNRKQYQEAIKAYEYLLAINPMSMNTYTNIANCYEALSDYTKAIETYNELMTLKCTKAYTYYRIGLCFKAQKQNGAALSAFQKSLIEDPQFYLSMMEQSYLYEERGEILEALHFAKEATTLNDSNLEYHKRLAFLYICLEKFDESTECLKKITYSEPERFYNWYAYADILMLMENYDQAALILQDAVKKHDRAELYYQLSNCLILSERIEEGYSALKVALQLDPHIANEMWQKYPQIKEAVRLAKSRNKKLN